MSDFSAKISAILDTKQLQSQLKAIQNGTYTININANVANVNQFTNNIKAQLQQAGNAAGNSFSNAFSNSLGKIHLKNGSIGNISRMLSGAGFDKNSISTALKDLDKMVVSVNKLTTKQLQNGNIKLTIGGVDELGRAVTVVREFDRVTGAVANTSKTFTQSFDNGAKAARKFSQTLNTATSAMQNGKIGASVAQVVAQYEKLGNTGHAKLGQIKTDIEELKRIQTALSTSTSQTDIVANYEKFDATLKKIRNSLNTVAAENKTFVSSFQINSLSEKMNKWMGSNTKANKLFGNQMASLRTQLAGLANSGQVTASQLNKIEQEFLQIKLAASQAGATGQTFFSSIRGAVSSISRYIGASTLIYTSISILKNGVRDVVELDTALIDLQKTTTATASELKEFYYSSNDVAKSLGVTTKAVIQAAADWSRLGYSIKDAQTMAEVSSIFASISPGMGMEEATDGLVSVMKAFNIEASDALDGIASKINIIGNTQALANDDIVAFLTRSSSAMAEANNSLEQTIALGTAAVEVTRDASSVGNALKTKFTKLSLYTEMCA